VAVCICVGVVTGGGVESLEKVQSVMNMRMSDIPFYSAHNPGICKVQMYFECT
jgi:hypothetical protein